MSTSTAMGQTTCPRCGVHGFHPRQGDALRCGIRRCRCTFRVVDGQSIECEVPAPPPRFAPKPKYDPVPRDRRRKPRSNPGVGRPIRGRDLHQIERFQRDRVGVCPQCEGRDIAPAVPGEATYLCSDCWAKLGIGQDGLFFIAERGDREHYDG